MNRWIFYVVVAAVGFLPVVTLRERIARIAFAVLALAASLPLFWFAGILVSAGDPEGAVSPMTGLLFVIVAAPPMVLFCIGLGGALSRAFARIRHRESPGMLTAALAATVVLLLFGWFQLETTDSAWSHVYCLTLLLLAGGVAVLSARARQATTEQASQPVAPGSVRSDLADPKNAPISARSGLVGSMRSLIQERSRRGWWAFAVWLLAVHVCAIGLASRSLLHGSYGLLTGGVVLLSTAVVAFQWYRPTILAWLLVLALTAAGIERSLQNVISLGLSYPLALLPYDVLMLGGFVCVAIAGRPTRSARAPTPRPDAPDVGA